MKGEDKLLPFQVVSQDGQIKREPDSQQALPGISPPRSFNYHSQLIKMREILCPKAWLWEGTAKKSLINYLEWEVKLPEEMTEQAQTVHTLRCKREEPNKTQVFFFFFEGSTLGARDDPPRGKTKTELSLDMSGPPCLRSSASPLQNCRANILK